MATELAPVQDSTGKEDKPAVTPASTPTPTVATIDEALWERALLRVISDLGLARTTKLTPPILKTLLQRIKDGNYIEVACESCGIDTATFYNWCNKAKVAPAGLYAELVGAIKKAQGQAEVDRLALVAVKDNWQPHMTILERSHADRWSLKKELNVNLQVGIDFSQELYDASHAPEIVEGEARELPD